MVGAKPPPKAWEMDQQGQEGNLHVCAELKEDKEKRYHQRANQDVIEEAGTGTCRTMVASEDPGSCPAQPRGDPLELAHT